MIDYVRFPCSTLSRKKSYSYSGIKFQTQFMIYYQRTATRNGVGYVPGYLTAWWRHQMETFSALLALCVINSLVTGEFPAKGQWSGALMHFFIFAWMNGWVNNLEAGDLRHYHAHYDLTVTEHASLSDHSINCLTTTKHDLTQSCHRFMTLYYVLMPKQISLFHIPILHSNWWFKFPIWSW